MKRLIVLWIMAGMVSLSAQKASIKKTRVKPVEKSKVKKIEPKKRKIEDKLLAIIYHPEGTVLLCRSDLRPDLSQREPTLREAIIRELIVLDGKKLKITVADAEVDRALARAQEQLKLNKDELVEFFKKQGFTLNEAKKELEKSILIENVIEARIRNKAHVSKHDLEEYHKQNPIEHYKLSRSLVPFQGGSKALIRTLVEREIASGDVEKVHEWIDIGTVEGKDFSAEKAYIKDLKEGSVTIAEETEEGIVLLRLDSKVVVPFEERKNDIALKLRQERYQKVQDAYYDKLLKDANVRYIN